MAEAIRVHGPINAAGLDMTLETGKLANLADGAVVVRVGGTELISTVASATPREGIDFFPLTVDVEERMYAAGKIPGSFFRREGRPGEAAILTCRLTDRPLRPSFPEGFRDEVQVIATILGTDMENPHDVLSINGASAALMISGIPFNGPVGAVRLAFNDGEWIAHPTYAEGAESTFEMVVAGRVLEDGDVAIMMVEAGGTEGAAAKFADGSTKVDEDVIAGGLEASKQWISASCKLQLELRAAVEAAKGPIETKSFQVRVDYQDDAFEAVQGLVGERTDKVMQIADKHDRQVALDELKEELVSSLAGTAEAPGAFADRAGELKKAFSSLQKKLVRSRIVNEGKRIDGRGLKDIRPLSAEVGVLGAAHGSGLFQRGETQVLSVATLGMLRMEQMIDSLGVEERKRYLHHYNFMPFSTGEVGRVGSPKRREIGHGALAARALVPVLPDSEAWPYTLRVVSDVLASNGSTSMGSVCGSSLSLMDAGVPIAAPVAGIAMGLVFAEGKYTTLTDILGAEDAFGDMDFKVAGTAEYVTALQLDTKIDGIPADVLANALQQAKEARLQILDVMSKAISAPREDVRAGAPKIISFEIPIDKVGEVIGPKGKVINEITKETGADVAVSDNGTVGIISIGSKDSTQVDAARERIMLIIDPPKAEIGEIYEGTVVSVTNFGAFINILPGRDGLMHISKVGRGKRVDRVEDVLNVGDTLQVQVDDIDPVKGKVSLTYPAGEGTVSDEQSHGGEDAATPAEAAAPRSSEDRERRPRRDRDDRSSAADDGDMEVLDFDAHWESAAVETFGDLGPADERREPRSDGPRRDGRGRGGPRRGGRR